MNARAGFNIHRCLFQTLSLLQHQYLESVNRLTTQISHFSFSRQIYSNTSKLDMCLRCGYRLKITEITSDGGYKKEHPNDSKNACLIPRSCTVSRKTTESLQKHQFIFYTQENSFWFVLNGNRFCPQA